MKINKGTYSISDLKWKDDSQQEKDRIITIYNELKEKGLKKEFLSEHEKIFIFGTAQLLKGEQKYVHEYSFCDNPKFKFLYIVYSWDITGGSFYNKEKDVNVPTEEVQSDLKYLISKADEWEEVVLKENHSDQLLLQTAKEARHDLKSLDSQPEFKERFSKGSFRYRYKRWAVLLNSKYIYHFSQEIWETFDFKPFVIQLFGEDIAINEHSLIHIFNRHFLKITKPYDPQKSFHNRNFDYRNIGRDLQLIFNVMSKVSNPLEYNMNNIFFRVRGTIYILYTSVQTKGENGFQKKFRRLDSFYPVEKDTNLKSIIENYEEIILGEEISIFKPKLSQ